MISQSDITECTVGSLSSGFPTARHIRLAVKPTFAFTRLLRFPSGVSRPYKLLRYFLGEKRPTQTDRQTLSPPHRNKLKNFKFIAVWSG